MKSNDSCESLIEKYYRAIFLYCLQLLGQDIVAAEDCTQDVFETLLEKKNSLDFDQNMRGWLYATADRICKDFRKKETKRIELVGSIDEIGEIPDLNVLDDSAAVFDSLSNEEIQLLKEYYSEKYGERMNLAKKYGMTQSQLTMKIHAIRKKLAKSI